MSRVGERPIPVPPGVEIELQGGFVSVKGPKGHLSRTIDHRLGISHQDGVLQLTRGQDTPEVRAMHGLNRALVANMVTGVSAGFERRLELQGVGYRAALSGQTLTLTVGHSHPVEIVPPPGIQFEVPQPAVVVVKGANRETVGELAAKIRSVRPPEPYQGKGIRYQGERVKRKVGKAGKK